VERDFGGLAVIGVGGGAEAAVGEGAGIAVRDGFIGECSTSEL
jgi:hypothetical protein